MNSAEYRLESHSQGYDRRLVDPSPTSEYGILLGPLPLASCCTRLRRPSRPHRPRKSGRPLTLFLHQFPQPSDRLSLLPEGFILIPCAGLLRLCTARCPTISPVLLPLAPSSTTVTSNSWASWVMAATALFTVRSTFVQLPLNHRPTPSSVSFTRRHGMPPANDGSTCKRSPYINLHRSTQMSSHSTVLLRRKTAPSSSWITALMVIYLAKFYISVAILAAMT